MSSSAPSKLFAQRWHALLIENSDLQKVHLDLVASCTNPFSARHMAHLQASTVRLQILGLKVRNLVDEWAEYARPMSAVEAPFK